jgi:hypothetical protein
LFFVPEFGKYLRTVLCRCAFPDVKLLYIFQLIIGIFAVIVGIYCLADGVSEVGVAPKNLLSFAVKQITRKNGVKQPLRCVAHCSDDGIV